MRFAPRLGLTFFAIALIASTSFAANTKIIGKWRGRLSFDMKLMPKNMSSQDQQQMNDLKKLTFVMNFRKDNSYSSMATGGPIKKPKSEEGNWQQNANKISVTPKGKDGKSLADKTQVLTLSKDGKSLSGPTVQGVTMIFVR